MRFKYFCRHLCSHVVVVVPGRCLGIQVAQSCLTPVLFRQQGSKTVWFYREKVLKLLPLLRLHPIPLGVPWPNISTLPEAVLRHIFTSLPHLTLLNCRLLSRASGWLATALAFRHVRLEVAIDVAPCIGIAGSEEFRCWVREITLDAVLPVSEQELAGPGESALVQYARFLRVLPRLRFFSDGKSRC